MFFMAFLLNRLSASAHLVAQGGLKHPPWRRPGQAASGSIPNRAFTLTNATPTFLPKKIEDLRELNQYPAQGHVIVFDIPLVIVCNALLLCRDQQRCGSLPVFLRQPSSLQSR